MPMDRRQFVAAALAGAGSVVVGRTQEAPGPVTGLTTDPFQLRPLGNTGLQVSLIGAGTGMKGWMRQSNQTRLGREGFEALLRHAFDSGVRFFDCADLYGSHTYLAGAFADMPRDQYVVSTKIWTGWGGLQEPERPTADVVVERFRNELNTDYIDLVLLHCMADPNWPDQHKRHVDALADLKSRDIIRAHGVSIHSLAALGGAVTNPWVDSVHTRINAFGDGMDSPDPNVVAPVIAQLHEAGKGVVGMKLVGEGRYRKDQGKRGESIRYVLGLGTVDTMIVGFETPEEIDDFAASVRQALEALPATDEAAG